MSVNGTTGGMKDRLIIPSSATQNDQLLERTAKVPPMYTNVGIANVTLPDGSTTLTVIACARGLPPMIFEPHKHEWRPLA